MSIKNKRKEEPEKLEKVKPLARDLSESEKAQYERCKICRHSYWWSYPGSDNGELRCRFLIIPGVLVALKPEMWCEMFEENLGCMHCAHRRSEPKMLINGEKLVLCERVRVVYGRDEASLDWEFVDKEKKCSSYCRKEDE